MKLTRIPDAELPPEVRAMLDEMVEANREDIARVRAALAFAQPAPLSRSATTRRR